MTRPLPATAPSASNGSVGAAALLWQAFRDVVGQSDAADVGPGGPRLGDTVEHLPAVWDAIWQAADGEPPRIARFAHCPPVPALLEAVRRAFLLHARDEGALLEVPEVVRTLMGLERVQAAVNRDEARQLVDRLSGVRGLDLVVEVAHDMRSPLTSILFLVEMLRRGQNGASTRTQDRQLGLIYSAALGLSAMASDVIELAKGGDRLVEPQPVPFSVMEVIESVRDIVLPMAEEKGLSVELVRDGADARRGQPTALSRVLLNLTVNALKFTSVGAVTVSARAVDCTRVEFAVTDTGRGIPPEVLESLFDPFRPSRREHTFSSAGLGLSICRKLVQAMGGALAVETALHAGTRFHFTLELPLARECTAAHAAEHSAGEPPRAERADLPPTDSRRADSPRAAPPPRPAP